MRACGNDVPRAFVVLFLSRVGGIRPGFAFLRGGSPFTTPRIPPYVFVPGKFRGRFCHVSAGVCFSRGGVFGSRPLDRKTWTQKIYPDFGVAYYDRATPVITEGNERAIERATDRPRPSECPADRPRRLGDVPSVRVRKERPRACGRAGVRGRRRARCARVVRLFLTH